MLEELQMTGKVQTPAGEMRTPGRMAVARRPRAEGEQRPQVVRAEVAPRQVAEARRRAVAEQLAEGPARARLGAPQPEVRPAQARYHPQLKEFLLLYDDVRRASPPRRALLEFLQRVALPSRLTVPNR